MKATISSFYYMTLFFSVFILCQAQTLAMPPGTDRFFTGQVGTIYSKNSWTQTSDFITNGNTSATLSGNYVNITSATQDDWNNIVYITNNRTKLEKWNFKLRFRIVAWAGNSYGIGFGLKSANPNVQNDVMGFIQTTTSGAGGLYILKSGRTIMSTGPTLGVSLNDEIDLEGRFYDSVFQFTAHNITSGSTASMSFTYASNGSTHVVPNTGRFALMELGGTHQVQQIEISSEEITGANIVAIGDSKTIGYFSNTFAGRYAAQLRNNYGQVVISAGGADRVTHVLDRKDEVLQLAGSKYLLSIGSNDLRFGATLMELQTNYDSLVRTLQATGAQVYHIVLPEDPTKPLGVNLLAFRNWVAATYPAYYINVWDSVSTNDVLKGIYDTGDGVHLNQLANNKIYQAIVASNKLGGGATLPVKLLQFTARSLNNGAVLVNWKVESAAQAEEYTLLRSLDGQYFEEINKQLAGSMNDYRFEDDAVHTGVYYYQLKMKEADGKYSYSKVVMITNKQAHRPELTLHYSNGYHHFFGIKTLETALINWQLIDAAGRRHAHGSRVFGSGIHHLEVDMSKFYPGVYYLQLNAGDHIQTVCSFVR